MRLGGNVIDTNKLLEAVSRKVKPWDIERVFESEIVAKQFAARLFINVTGSRVARLIGGKYCVFGWIKEAKV